MDRIKYLIIGNGIAGLSAAKEIRNLDQSGSIVMVSSEASFTYYRVKLTEYISKEFKDEDLLVNKESWYQEKNIEILFKKIVEEIDTKNKRIRLDDSQILEYEKLLIATGSRPFIPPINGKYKEGVFALRTLRDLHQFKTYINKLDKISIIGGGLLGLEAAWALKELGKQVDIIEFAPYLLPRQLDKEIGGKLEERLEELGFNLYTGSFAEEILGENQANGIRLNDDKVIETGAILVSSGIRPNLDLIRETDIQFDKGIIVDDHMKTNIDSIYGAGDVVEINSMILGLWTAGNEQGKVAGANMAGGDLAYSQPKIFTNLQIGDIKLFSAGDINLYDQIHEYKNEEEGIHHKLFGREGRLVGIILFGDLKNMNNLRNAVINQMPIADYIKTDERFQ